MKYKSFTLTSFAFVAPNDYEAVNRVLEFLPEAERVCIDVVTENDDDLETAEQFRLLLNTSMDRVSLTPDETILEITDASSKFINSTL